MRALLWLVQHDDEQGRRGIQYVRRWIEFLEKLERPNAARRGRGYLFSTLAELRDWVGAGVLLDQVLEWSFGDERLQLLSLDILGQQKLARREQRGEDLEAATELLRRILKSWEDGLSSSAHEKCGWRWLGLASRYCDAGFLAEGRRCLETSENAYRQARRANATELKIQAKLARHCLEDQEWAKRLEAEAEARAE